MKRAALCILALLVGSTALAPFAAADGGLQAIMFITPEGAAIGQTIEVNVETYMDGVATNVDTLDVTYGLNATAITFTNPSAGHYHASFMITAGDVFFSSIVFSGSADLGVNSESLSDFYSIGGGAVTGWDVTLRAVSGGQLFTNVAPGANIVLEGRTYLNGQLTDGGPLNMTLGTTTGMDFGATPTESALTTTKLQDGVYQATLTVPSTLDASKSYNVKAWLGNNETGPSAESIFFAHPFTVQAYAESSTTTSAVLKVFVGLATPIAGANVSLEGFAISMGFPPSITTVGPFTATTDANGKATVNPTWSASSLISTWFLNVTSGGKKTSTIVVFAGQTSGGGWVPTPAIGYGCELRLQTDPSSVQAGQTANLRFRVTNNGTAVASTSVFRYAYREGASATTVAGNVTTDASGDFTMTWAVPAGWTENDRLEVQVVCPNGVLPGTDRVQSGTQNPFGTGKLTVSASGALGAAVTITATYTGTNALTNAVATCAIVPGNQSNIAGVGLAAGAFTAPMTRSGSTFTGSITVPLWMGEGNYTIVAYVTNEGATSTQSDQTQEGNTTTIHMTPQGSTGGNNPAPRGFLPGFEAPAAVGAVGAIAAMLVVGRRRREA